MENEITLNSLKHTPEIAECHFSREISSFSLIIAFIITGFIVSASKITSQLSNHKS